MIRLAALLLMAGAARADVAAITSQNAGMLTLVQTESLEIVASTSLPGKPAAVALDAMRGRVMAVAVETARLHVFDLARKKAIWFFMGHRSAVIVQRFHQVLTVSE